jgi:glycosyltransferase involved in cell wall biosynthesis
MRRHDRRNLSICYDSPASAAGQLPARYAGADLFVFPTIEDGHPCVLNQAMESAVPILNSTNCSGPDILTGDVTGCASRPAGRIFSSNDFWCDANRAPGLNGARRLRTIPAADLGRSVAKSRGWHLAA